MAKIRVELLQNQIPYKVPGFDDVVHELDAEPPAEADHLDRCPERLGKGGVEEAETQAVLQIADGINEGRIPEK